MPQSRLEALLIKKPGSRIDFNLNEKTSDFEVAGFGLLFVYERWMSCANVRPALRPARMSCANAQPRLCFGPWIKPMAHARSPDKPVVWKAIAGANLLSNKVSATIIEVTSIGVLAFGS